MLNFLLGIIFVALAFGQDLKKENPTWFIPSQEKPSSENDQSFCSQEQFLNVFRFKTKKNFTFFCVKLNIPCKKGVWV